MNAIDQFVNFVTTLYTPRRALATLFMLAGCILTLNVFLPYLTVLLEPALLPVTDKHKNYVVIIAVSLGISSGIVTFSLLCGVWSFTSQIYQKRKEYSRNLRREKEAEQAQKIQLVDDFKTAHPHLSSGKISIIRRLLTVPTESYLTQCPDISFLENSGWILPLAASSNDEKIYKISPVIQSIANKLWNEEVETNALLFISNDKGIYQFIINAFSDLKSSTEITDTHFTLYERYIKMCFDLQIITATCYNLKFKLRYKEKFEELINKKLYSQRMFTVSESMNQEPVPW